MASPSLTKAQITQVDIPGGTAAYRCEQCRRVWQPMIQSGRYAVPRGWWKCPNGCNADAG